MKKLVTLITLLMTSLTFGQTPSKKIKMHSSAESMKQELEKRIPIGSNITDAQRLLQANGFRCALKEKNIFVEVNDDKSIVEHNHIDFLFCDKSDHLLINTRLWQVAVVHQRGVVSELVNSVAKSPVLHRKDYIHMSDAELRSVLIKYAPLGSSEDEVRKELQKVFHRHFKEDKFTDEDPRYFSKLEKGDYILASRMQVYDVLKNLFLSVDYVESYWLFDKNGILKDVQVRHLWDGV